MYGETKHLKWCRLQDGTSGEGCSCEDTIRSIGGYISAFLLATISVTVAVKAYGRFFNPNEVFGQWVVVVALLGGMLNYCQHRVLEHGKRREAGRYLQVLGICLLIFIIELIGSDLSGSLALWSDAWHVLIDGGAAIISITVAWLVPHREDRHHVTHKMMDVHVWGDMAQSGAVMLAGALTYLTGESRIDSILSWVIAVVLLGWSIKISWDTYNGKYEDHNHRH